MTEVIMMRSQDPGDQIHIFCPPSPSLCFTFTDFYSPLFKRFVLRYFFIQPQNRFTPDQSVIPQRNSYPLQQLLVYVAEMSGKSCWKQSLKWSNTSWHRSQTNIKPIAYFFSRYRSAIMYVQLILFSTPFSKQATVNTVTPRLTNTSMPTISALLPCTAYQTEARWSKT